MELRGKSISYSSFIKKDNETQEKEIGRKTEEIEHNLTPENSIALDELKDQLQTLRKHKMHGHLISSRANIIQEDEKPTKYFCNLEKHITTQTKLFKVAFIHRGMDFIDLPSIFRDNSVISSIPTYFQNSETPIICYKYNKPIRSNIFKFNKPVSDLDIDTSTPDT